MGEASDYLIHVVEDDEQSRMFLCSFLKKLNFKVVESETGLVALKELENGTVPNLFLVDVMMPEMDGFELIAKIREIENLKETPIIMTTALDDAKHIKEAISAGANAYIVKPINIQRLKAKMGEFLEFA